LTRTKIPGVAAPSGYRAAARVKPKLGAYVPVIDRIVEKDRSAQPEHRHTAAPIDYRLRDEFG
jgi:hypothetical protein